MTRRARDRGDRRAQGPAPSRRRGRRRNRDDRFRLERRHWHVFPQDRRARTIGVLVQSNYGGRLTIAGVPVWTKLSPDAPRAGPRPGDADGSCMIIVATDAPLDTRDLERLAARAIYALARTGSTYSNGSGDYAIAFSTDRSIESHRGGRPATTARAADRRRVRLVRGRHGRNRGSGLQLAFEGRRHCRQRPHGARPSRRSGESLVPTPVKAGAAGNAPQACPASDCDPRLPIRTIRDDQPAKISRTATRSPSGEGEVPILAHVAQRCCSSLLRARLKSVVAASSAPPSTEEPKAPIFSMVQLGCSLHSRRLGPEPRLRRVPLTTGLARRLRSPPYCASQHLVRSLRRLP